MPMMLSAMTADGGIAFIKRTYQLLKPEFEFEQDCNSKQPEHSAAGSQAHCSLIKEEGCHTGTCNSIELYCSPEHVRIVELVACS